MKLPIFVEVSGLKILVVGGGEEAYKKARRFLNAGAYISILSLDFSEEVAKLHESNRDRVRLIKADARNHELLEKLIASSDIVISALNEAKEIDDAIIELSRKHGKLYILAGDAERTMGAMGIEGASGEIRFAVFTDGKSSLVAMEARDRIKGFLDQQEDLHEMLSQLGYMKQALKKSRVDPDTRIAIHREVFKDPRYRALIKEKRYKEAFLRLKEMVYEKTGVHI